jgi:hypothetical protein
LFALVLLLNEGLYEVEEVVVLLVIMTISEVIRLVAAILLFVRVR